MKIGKFNRFRKAVNKDRAKQLLLECSIPNWSEHEEDILGKDEAKRFGLNQDEETTDIIIYE